jgi:4-amino-4-deoxychorismate lyase
LAERPASRACRDTLVEDDGVVLVNGQPVALVDVADRGLQFGDGIFRTLLVRAGRPLNWDRHFRRLARDCAALALPVPDEGLLRAEMARVAPQDAVVKITLTRGVSGRGYSLPTEVMPTRIVAAFSTPPYPPELARDGIRVRRCVLKLSEQPLLAGVKTLNRLESVLARAEWFDPEIREGLLCDASGHLVEATMSNVFLVRNDGLATPDLSRCGVAGAQRERVIEFARAAGISCEVRHVDLAEVRQADEVFLTNSLIGIWPVARFEDCSWTPGAVTRQLQALLEADDARGA